MTKTQDMEPFGVIHVVKEIVPPVLLPLPDAALAALVCVFAFAAAAQKLSSVLLPHASAEFLVFCCVHSVDGITVFAVFVFMMQGQGEGLFGASPFLCAEACPPCQIEACAKLSTIWVSSSLGVFWKWLLWIHDWKSWVSAVVTAGVRSSGTEIDGLFLHGHQ